MNIRKIHYVIIHVPFKLIEEAKELIEKRGIQSEQLIFSTDHTFPHDKAITIEDDSLNQFRKEGQNAVALHLPIEETNRWTKLSQKYPIRVDLYYSPMKAVEKVEDFM